MTDKKIQDSELDALDREAQKAADDVKDAWWRLGETLRKIRAKLPSNNAYGAHLEKRDYFGLNPRRLSEIRTAFEFASVFRLIGRQIGYDLLCRINAIKNDADRQEFVDRLQAGERVKVREVLDYHKQGKQKQAKATEKVDRSVDKVKEALSKIEGLSSKQQKQVKAALDAATRAGMEYAQDQMKAEVEAERMRAIEAENKYLRQRKALEARSRVMEGQKKILELNDYRALLQVCHPDKGGSNTAFRAVKLLEEYVSK